MYRYLLLTALLLPVLAHADLNDAMQALKNGDHTRAAREFKQLAEQGNAIAQSHLGYLYYAGEGVPQSYEEAVKWYQNAAVQGNRDAQYNLAVAYAFGEGIKQNYKEAAIWYRRAAEQGHAVAQYSLGLSYAYGEGVKQDEKQAAAWFLKSAEQGYENAQVMVGSLYHTGDGLEKDYTRAVEWYRKAADKGSAIAQYNLGTIYRAGKGVNKNTDEAIKWFRLAADQGYEPAQNELSTIERAMAGAAQHQTPPVPPFPPKEDQAAKTGIPVSTDIQTVTTTKQTEKPAPASQETESKPAQEDKLQLTEQAAGEHEKETETTVAKTESESDRLTKGTDEEQTGGFFSRLKNIFTQEETPAATETTTDLETPEPAVSAVTTGPAPDPVPATKTESAPETEPEQKTIASDPEKPASIKTKRPFTLRPPENNSSIQELVSRQRALAPQIEAPPVQNRIQSDIEQPVAKAEPEPEISPDRTIGKTEAVMDITDNQPAEKAQTISTKEKSGIKTEAGVTTTAEVGEDESDKAKTGGVFGFLGRMFSPDKEPDSKTEAIESTDLVAMEATQKEEETTYSAVTYSADSKPGDAQLAEIADEVEVPEEETIVSGTEPDITEIEKPPVSEEPETPAVTAETSEQETIPAAEENKDEEKESGSFFSRLFGGSKDEAEETVINDPDQSIAATTTKDDEKSLPDPDWNQSLEEPAEPITDVETENAPAVTTESTEQTLQIAKADVETESLPLENKVEDTLEEKIVTSPIDSLKALAVSGEATAQFELGKHYYEGNQVKQDYTEAFIWYRRAALQGNVEAQYNLGNMYLMGEGIAQNDFEAGNWYEKAADQGHLAARHNFENLQRAQPEVTADPETAEETRTLTEASTPPEEKRKGVLGFIGGLFGSDDSQEIQPEQSITESKTTPIPKPAATAQLKSPAESDHDRGLAYTHGDGVPKNDTTAFKYFQSAALQGYAPAQYQLGVAYESGKGTQKDINSAIEWYEKSARQGFIMAQRSLGNIYMNAEGVEQNKPLALAWYSILAEKGNVLDVHRRDLLKEQLTDAEIRESERLKQQLSASLSTASTSY